MDHLFYLLPIYMALGCLVGFCAGMLGVGGGILLVPGLYAAEKYFGTSQYVLSGLMPMALATSMCVIIPTGLSSSRAQIKRGAVRWDAFRLMAPGLVAGVILGITVVTKLENSTLKMIFSVGLYVIAALIYLRKESSTPHDYMMKPAIAVPAGLGIGVLATMLGMGGATLNIPYLNRAGVPLRNAIATSSVLGVVVALPAAIGFLITGALHGNTFQHINLLAWIIIAPLSILMAPVGVRAGHALPAERLKLIFALLLVVLATKMLFET